jgi:hypothetical protein
MRGLGLRLVISQPEAALYIHDPMFETTVALHMTENAICLNGLSGELAARVISDLFVVMLKAGSQLVWPFLALPPIVSEG